MNALEAMTLDSKAMSLPLKRFFTYLRPNIWLVLAGVAVLPVSVWASLSVPLRVIGLVDSSIPLGNRDAYINEVLTLAGIVLAGIFADGIFMLALERAGINTIQSMRQSLFVHCLKLKRTYFDHHPIGVLLTRLTSDFEALSESLAIGMISMFSDLIKGIVLLSVLFTINFKMAAAFMLMLPVAFLVMRFMQAKLRAIYFVTRQALANATGYLQECLAGMRTIRLYAAEEQAAENYTRRNRIFLNAQVRANIYETSLFSFIDGFTMIAIAALLWYGATLSVSGALTAGVLIGFITSVQRIFVPIREFTQQVTNLQRSMAALRGIDILFSQPTESRPPSQTGIRKGFESLEFENVCFRYGDDKPLVLQDISFSLKRGQKLAFVGSTGSGKSTIIKLITKQYEGYEGSIRINGRELSELTHTDLLDMVSLMQQDVFMFEETVDFNIILDRSSEKMQTSKAAASYVMADGFIEDLPGAYGFTLRGQTGGISTGEKQLLAFARSVAADNDLFILDEATGSVDSVTEEMIEKAVAKILSEKTVIAIAHRLSTIRGSDMILVMDKGSIVERGSHDELLAQQGRYYRLVKE